MAAGGGGPLSGSGARGRDGVRGGDVASASPPGSEATSVHRHEPSDCPAFPPGTSGAQPPGGRPPRRGAPRPAATRSAWLSVPSALTLCHQPFCQCHRGRLLYSNCPPKFKSSNLPKASWDPLATWRWRQWPVQRPSVARAPPVGGKQRCSRGRAPARCLRGSGRRRAPREASAHVRPTLQGEDLLFLATDVSLPGAGAWWWCRPASAFASC